MPEVPDLIYIEAELARAFPGHRVVAVRAGDPVPFRIMIDGKLSEILCGKRLLTVERRGHFLRFGFDHDLVLVINAMLAGRYAITSADGENNASDPQSLILAMSFDNGKELRYLDAKRMGKVYVAMTEQEHLIPYYGSLGVDVMSSAFTKEVFDSLLRGRRDQVRNFLMDKTALASIGNAYADEILFAAGLHPKTFCYQLSKQDGLQLFENITPVLRHAADHVARVGPDLQDKVRDFLSVRGRAGKPCTKCKTTVRSVRVNSADANFCPTCQPARRALFIDWNRKP